MVCRKHADDAARIESLQDKRGQANRWSGVARLRLTHNLIGGHLGELALDFFSNKFVRDDPEVFFMSGRTQPFDSFLDHALGAIQRQHLLG